MMARIHRVAEPLVTVVGDVMKVILVQSDALARPNRTMIVDWGDFHYAGPTINIVRHLARGGARARIVAAVGADDAPVLRKTLIEAMVGDEGLVEVDSRSNLLVAALRPSEHRSVFVRALVPRAGLTRIGEHLRSVKTVVVAGSRDPGVQRAVLRAVRGEGRDLIAFNPSYAIGEYVVDDLEAMLQVSDIVLMNESEVGIARRILGCKSLESLGRACKGELVATLGAEGAVLVTSRGVQRVSGTSKRRGEFVGSGDVLAAVYITLRMRGVEAMKSLQEAVSAASDWVKTGWSKEAIQLRPVSPSARRSRGTDLRRRLKAEAGR